MSFKAAEASVRAFFNTSWAAKTPISWPDVAFTPPNNSSWVRFAMKPDDAYQASIGSPGSNRFRRKGKVIIQVFQPQGMGSTDARDKADDAVDIFMANNLAGFIFKNVVAKDIGPDGAGWYQWNVYADYQYDVLA